MTRRSRLRARLLVALAGLSVAVLVVTAAVTFGLARATDRQAALDELHEQAPEIAESMRALVRATAAGVEAGEGEVARRAATLSDDIRAFLASLRNIARAARFSDANVLLLGPDGLPAPRQGEAVGLLRDEELQTVFELPAGLDWEDLDTTALVSGDAVDGRIGRTVFVAEPIFVAPEGTAALVLTRDLDPNPLGRIGPFFLFAAASTLLVALLISWWLARRMTRPLAAVEQTAATIAAGDLSARVDVGTGADDEMASLAATLNDMAAQLEHARGLEREFLLSVSHDLRTPLTSIRGYAEAIADGAIEGATERVRAAEVIASESRRLERLVADLLDLARLDAHEFSLRPRAVDAAAVVTASAEAFVPAAEEAGVSLAMEGDGPIPAEADPERLGQVVANLVENGLKYAAAAVTVGVGTRDDEVEIRVVDDGPGIDPADLPRVFDRLYTSRRIPGRRVGTGLGLAIVRELTGAMGGTVGVESSPGQGTRFVVRLPILAAARAEGSVGPPSAGPALAPAWPDRPPGT
ncbi:MAG: HAMP domain-containing histidine kinase [Acidimicrobiia bacterium]|nr:HAMP domain-containing histidine kinase [Acidimicrobiia bacterium]